MAKKRRERDRPKAAHDSLYNPNKRVLLSYESEEEEDNDGAAEQPIVTASLAEPVVDTANYQIPEYPDDEEDEENAAEIRTHRVDHSHDVEADDEGGEDEGTPRNQDSLWTRGGTRKNNTTGQWPALGSLSYQWEEDEGIEEEFDSEEEEAMAYLRAVRCERQGMPEVFTAAKTFSHEELYENGVGDTRGYIDDGAYVGRESLNPTTTETEEMSIDPQEAYTATLKKRFLGQRYQMHVSPGAEALASLDERHPISFPRGNSKAYAEWRQLLKSSTPQPSQVRAMDQTTVHDILELMQKYLLVCEKELPPNTSTWIWALLARLNDVGTMNNDQVWFIREFGKKAILVQLSFYDPDAAKQLQETSPAENNAVPKSNTESQRGDNEGNVLQDDQNYPRAEVSEPPKQTSQGVDRTRQNTLATLDAIIVVVGEVFGQRDLLEFRQPWTRAEELEKT